MLLAGTARAQAPLAADSLMASDHAPPVVLGRWVLDSTPTQKNRRQTYLAATSATDTVKGKYRASKPILKLYHAS